MVATGRAAPAAAVAGRLAPAAAGPVESADAPPADERDEEGGFVPTDLERLSYSIADAYLPVWFERRTGWEGRTYEDAMRFCRSHNDFVPVSVASGALVVCHLSATRQVVFSEAAQDT